MRLLIDESLNDPRLASLESSGVLIPDSIHVLNHCGTSSPEGEGA